MLARRVEVRHTAILVHTHNPGGEYTYNVSDFSDSFQLLLDGRLCQKPHHITDSQSCLQPHASLTDPQLLNLCTITLHSVSLSLSLSLSLFFP